MEMLLMLHAETKFHRITLPFRPQSASLLGTALTAPYPITKEREDINQLDDYATAPVDVGSAPVLEIEVLETLKSVFDSMHYDEETDLDMIQGQFFKALKELGL